MPRLVRRPEIANGLTSISRPGGGASIPTGVRYFDTLVREGLPILPTEMGS